MSRAIDIENASIASFHSMPIARNGDQRKNVNLEKGAWETVSNLVSLSTSIIQRYLGQNRYETTVINIVLISNFQF